MKQQVTLVIPEAPLSAPDAPAAQRKLEKRGIRLGILDNGKGNADHLLKFVVEGIKVALPVVSVIALRKRGGGIPVSTAMLDQFLEKADFVVSAMAD